jgi:hypothetical protein
VDLNGDVASLGKDMYGYRWLCGSLVTKNVKFVLESKMFRNIISKFNKFKDRFHVGFARLQGYEYVRNDRGAREFIILEKYRSCPPPYNASAICSNIYWENSNMNNLRTLKHELSHVEDFKKLGFIVHSIMYGVCDIVFGYDDNPFEIKARVAEER